MGGIYFCRSCWLQTSGFHEWMLKPRCLVFPFHWLKGQAGLCLAPTHLPSPFSCKGGVIAWVAYLRSRYGIWRPFCLDHAGPAVELRAGSVTAHRQLILRRPIRLDVYPPGFVENTAWILGRLAHFLPFFHLFCFPGGVLLDLPETPFSTSSCAVYRFTSSVLSFLRKAVERTKCVLPCR